MRPHVNLGSTARSFATANMKKVSITQQSRQNRDRVLKQLCDFKMQISEGTAMDILLQMES